MGPYLAVPKKEKESYDGENNQVTIYFKPLTNFLVEIWRHRNARMA
jgi:hypothetical protein